MDKRFKKKFYILLAILLGAAVVYVATKSVSTEYSTNNWKDALSVVPQKYSLTTSGNNSTDVSVPSVAATTTTDIIARRLLLEYAAVQNKSATTTLSDADASNIANTLVQGVAPAQEKEYALKDLNISSDNSSSAATEYTTSLAALLQKQILLEQKKSEVDIFLSALNANDAKILAELSSRVVIYQQLIKNLLALKTPSLVAPTHLHLVQGYETLRSATVRMQDVLVDPVVGVTGLTEYQSGVDIINATAQEYHNLRSSNE